MKPIRDIAELSPGGILYHSAFGFAHVVSVEPDRVKVQWESGGFNLPQQVSHAVLQRVYAKCARNGFFERAFTDPETLAEQLQTHPSDSLAELLDDLAGPQTVQDLREWIVGRGLLTDDGFERWWRMAHPHLIEDIRFTENGGAFSNRSTHDQTSVLARLVNPLLAPGRRLDIALSHREEIGSAAFLDQIMLAWRTGGTQVRDLALAAVSEEAPDTILDLLLGGGRDNIDALIHAIRHARWKPEEVAIAVHHRLLSCVLEGCAAGGPLDAEGRLAATLHRWGSPGIDDALLVVASTGDGKRLLRATVTNMPPRRAEALGLHLLTQALESEDSQTAQWLGGEILGFALLNAQDMADRLEDEHPTLADWYRYDYVGVDGRLYTPLWDDSNDSTAYTAEIDLADAVSEPVPLAEVPARPGSSLLGLGLAIARALALHHKGGRIVNPSAQRVRLHPNDTIEIDLSDDDEGVHQVPGEPPSPARDVYSCAVLLLELMLGRPWPEHIPGHRCLPFLRNVVTLLPPSALAPLESALHIDPSQRPKDGLVWLTLWQSAAVSEEARSYAAIDTQARLRTGYDSHIGRMKVLLTQTNQDAVFVSTVGALSLLLVCDGISTANVGSGDVASSIACHVIASLWERAAPRLALTDLAEHQEFLDRALRAANTAVCEAATRFAGGNLDGRVPMGTTVVAALVHGNQVCLTRLGDSRAYLTGPFGASLLTADENLASERMRAWHLHFLESWEPVGFALIGYLGHFNELLRPEALPAHHANFTLSPGESLVLCSDGVTDYAADTSPEVTRIIAQSATLDDPYEIARALVAHANRGGGGDNASCVVVNLI